MLLIVIISGPSVKRDFSPGALRSCPWQRKLRPGSLLASRGFLYVLKLGDLDGSFRELGGDF